MGQGVAFLCKVLAATVVLQRPPLVDPKVLCRQHLAAMACSACRISRKEETSSVLQGVAFLCKVLAATVVLQRPPLVDPKVLYPQHLAAMACNASRISRKV